MHARYRTWGAISYVRCVTAQSSLYEFSFRIRIAFKVHELCLIMRSMLCDEIVTSDYIQIGGWRIYRSIWCARLQHYLDNVWLSRSRAALYLPDIRSVLCGVNIRI